MANSIAIQPLKLQWVEMVELGTTGEFLAQNNSQYETLYVRVSDVAPAARDISGAFELRGHASMNRLDEGKHWVWSYDHVEPMSAVKVVVP